jgi:uncharacterized protein (TIGR03083 family)
MTVPLDRDQVWQAIDTQRTDLTVLLEDLSDDEWQQPSLCPGWTVRDVAAHLTLIGEGAAALAAHLSATAPTARSEGTS